MNELPDNVTIAIGILAMVMPHASKEQRIELMTSLCILAHMQGQLALAAKISSGTQTEARVLQ